jgi:type IV secretion system protein VirB10
VRPLREPDPTPRTEVVGERGQTVANAARSVQSRVTSALAGALFIALAATALVWYYSRALSRQSHARQLAQSAAATRAQGEMPLPALGPITAPSATPAAPADPDLAGPPPELPLQESRGAIASPGVGYAPAGIASAPQPTADPRLSASVFARDSQLAGPVAPPSAASERNANAPSGAPDPGDRATQGLGALLRPTELPASRPDILPTERFLLAKGAFIDCTLETAIDSTLPGMTTCITAADTFGADGKVVLLERGTKLVGETRGQVQQGQARVFVVWTQARTPAGVVVPLDSPGTDELGRSGLPGEVERHFWQRFGAAMLISLVDGAVQAGVQSMNRSGGTVVYAPSTSTDVLTEVLKSTIEIPPTIVKRNGDRIQVLVARDVDFRSVYELRAIGR